MDILVIDGQGGNIGRQLIKSIREAFPEVTITAVGTNSIATQNMLKSGASRGATGENSVMFCARSADIIIGPIGIAIPDSMLGEVTPAMATAIGQSRAKRIFIPINHCDNNVAGVKGKTVQMLIEDAVSMLAGMIDG
ncbi:MAG: DUF3842 family protein [Oscillospiraceae bacterium]|nr:DUF3842 family protein [Oscillospiraceae bacterium]